MGHENPSHLSVEADPRLAEVKRFRFRLYISKENSAAEQAVKNLGRICRQLGEEACEVEIIDVYAQPSRAEMDRVLAIPTLIKSDPLPVIRIIGDLRDSQKILETFGLSPMEDGHQSLL